MNQQIKPYQLIGLRILLMSVVLGVLFGCSSSGVKINADKERLAALKASMTDSQARQVVVKSAIKQLGVNYRFGGISPSEGFDCSGLAFHVYLNTGRWLPRKSQDQFTYANKSAQPKPGDLVFFSSKTKLSQVDHVGILLKDDLFIHAPGKGREVSTSRLSDPYWQKRFQGSGSYID
jgi:cell wall-associated NlpC family hydrolase